jgi:hypothetical protein
MLGGEGSLMDGSEILKNETEPGVSVKDVVGGVESCGEDLAKAVEGGDAGPGQLRVRDVVISEGLLDIEGGDVDVVTEAEEKFVRRGGLLGDAGVR